MPQPQLRPPRHLEPVTRAENIQRGQAGAFNRSKQTCPEGHAYTGDNLRLKPLPSGGFGRICRACARAQDAAAKRSKRAKPRMTVFFPDISSYEAGLTIQPGTVAVIAKATEGTYYRDAQYQNFKAQAAQVGAVFSAYHFLKAGNGAAQADYCHAMVGNIPVMLDVETEGNSKPTVADCLAFIARMRALGGRVWGVYFPRWYWEQVGGNLALLGVALVASGYPGDYSDTDPDWKPYGGVAPADLAVHRQAALRRAARRLQRLPRHRPPARRPDQRRHRHCDPAPDPHNSKEPPT